MVHVVYDPEDDPLMARPVSVYTRGLWQNGITLFAETGLAIVNGVEEAGPSDATSPTLDTRSLVPAALFAHGVPVYPDPVLATRCLVGSTVTVCACALVCPYTLAAPPRQFDTTLWPLVPSPAQLKPTKLLRGIKRCNICGFRNCMGTTTAVTAVPAGS
jgi:hypothetical protein